MQRNLRAEHVAWQKYKKWQAEHKNEIREGQEITSLGQFKIIYNEVGRKINFIKNEVRYQMSRETFDAFNKRYKEALGKNLSTKRRADSTQDLADLLLDEITKYKKEMLDSGKSNAAANKAVSSYYFGS